MSLKPDTHYPFGKKHCVQCFFVERAVKPDTHYRIERAVWTGRSNGPFQRVLFSTRSNGPFERA